MPNYVPLSLVLFTSSHIFQNTTVHGSTRPVGGMRLSMKGSNDNAELPRDTVALVNDVTAMNLAKPPLPLSQAKYEEFLSNLPPGSRGTLGGLRGLFS